MFAGASVLTFVTFFLVICTTNAAKLPKRVPERFPICSRNDPKLNECLLKATDAIRPFLKEGVPELRLSPIDPFTVPEIKLDQKRRTLDIKALLKNVKITGLSNYKFSKFEFNPEKLEWKALIAIPNLKLDGYFSVNGTVVQVAINGEGPFTADVETCEVSYHEKAILVKKNGVDYLSPQESKSSIQVTKPRVKLGGTLAGSSDISGVANKVIEDNIDILFDDLKPTLEEIISQIAKGTLFDVIQSQLPYDSLYPPSL